MFTAGGAPGEVHSYFSPYGTPTDAFVTAQAAILDFENRARLAAVAADEPFLFYTGTSERYYAGTMAWSLKGFIRAIQRVSLKSLQFHNSRGDFEKWVEKSLQDKTLVSQLRKERLSKLDGEELRKAIIKIMQERLVNLTAQTQTITKYF
jgi:alpha-amylase